MRTILPCAGFGTRLGMREHESKEMLFYEGERLIDQALDGVENPWVISRIEKKELNSYLETRACAHQILRGVSGEWPTTVLSSQDFWEEDNLLVLPDTTWNARSASFLAAKRLLEAGSDVVFGVHEVKDPSNWGIIDHGFLKEKPREALSNLAWGFIAFKKKIGEPLFEAMKDRRPFELPLDVSFIELKNFRDLTRSWADLNLKKELE